MGYLQKLWTVYELGSFLLLDPTGRMAVIPVFLPRQLVQGVLGFYFCFILEKIASIREVQHILDGRGLSGFLRHVTGIGTSFIYLVLVAVFLRKWARDKARIHPHVQNFSIVNALCTKEADRPVVHRNVACFMKASGLIEVLEHDNTALSVFDRLVQKVLPLKIQASIGHVGVRYHHVVMLFLAQGLHCLDIAGGVLASKEYTQGELV